METYIKIIKDQKKHILVVGDIMLDEYIIGHDYRISDEAPVPIVKVDCFNVCLGGASNVAYNIKSLGGNVSLCGAIGNKDDASSGLSNRRIVKLLNDNNISLDSIVSSGHKTTTKTRVVIKKQQVVRYDYEDGFLLPETKNKISNVLTNLNFDCIDAIVVSDYNKGVIDSASMSVLKKTKLPIIVDPKPSNKDLYRDVFCLTPNIVEFNGLSKCCIDITSSEEQLFFEAKKLREEMNIYNLIVTMGERGALAISESCAKIIPSLNIPITNTIGAGDTFISMLSLALVNHIPVEDSIYLSNMAAAISISKPYTGNCSIDELIELNKKINNK